ncbi:DMT family transporter [Nocardia carnea]|uniref:DMT family transporter n=1 Tax=Nocardia carnea TaxID=37328 RepID=UPI0024540292|nr:multidrug efflux SMR transporter [Nocardia carnea]
MTYLLLAIAIVIELVATTLIKYTEGFTRLWPTVICLACYAASFFALAQTINRGMEVGVAYALWGAIGTAAIATIGVLYLGDSFSTAKVLGIGFVIIGVVTLNLGGAH